MVIDGTVVIDMVFTSFLIPQNYDQPLTFQRLACGFTISLLTGYFPQYQHPLRTVTVQPVEQGRNRRQDARSERTVTIRRGYWCVTARTES